MMNNPEPRDTAIPVPEESEYKEGDRVAKLWFLFAALWFPIFATLGFLLAIKFFFPTFLSESAWDTFGRIRPSHVNGVLFGFVSSGLLGAMFYITPRLCARGLYRAKLALVTPFLWNFAVIGGIIWILLGGSQGREYAELPWGIDVAVMVALALNAFIIWGTVIKRREKKLYVSLWYYLGTTIWFPIVYFIGNVMWKPPEGALNGTTDAVFNWYYGHNVLGLWFTTLGIAAWYYFIPKMLKRPLYSHLLSLIAFFSIAFFYTGVGGHHLLQSPIPEWLKTMAVTMSVLMMVPVLAFLVNIGLTMRGSWHRLTRDTSLQFVFAGFVMYVLVSIQGTLQGLRSTNAYLHFSQWPVSHSHLALLGGFGFLVAGMAYFLLPRVTGFKIFSPKLMRWSWWLAFVGFLSFFASMVVTGLQQNANWYTHINVVETLPTLTPDLIWRAVSGGVIVIGAILFAYNIFMTFFQRGEAHQEEHIEVIEPITEKLHSNFLRRSQEHLNVPIIVGGGLAVFSIMTFMVVAMPYMFAADAPTWRAHELTPQEQEGQAVYKSMGCFYCHNQFIRPQDWAMGYTSEAGDFYYSIPNFLGTERTGPSLGQIGGKRPTEWNILHIKDPRSVSPSSIMPSFGDFLTDSQLEALVAYLQTLGSEDLATHDFQQPVPYEFRFNVNPNLPLMTLVQAGYDSENDAYAGPEAEGAQWATLLDEGKVLFTEKCLSCHGCSGNGQGPYARQTVTRPANLFERISNFPPDNPEAFHYWRIFEGVPGTAMPAWGLSLDEDTIWKIATYELSFTAGSIRTVDGEISDNEGDQYDADNHPMPIIAGTLEDFEKGQSLYNLYCAQCHGTEGHGDGPASIATAGGYIRPEPANFEESGSDFTNYGRWVWKVTEGVETTNMPPWKYALSKDEIALVIFYEQSFSTPEDYNSKWAPLYTDPFAQNLKR
jgi:cytochrome c oxidase cbb3-type subunit I/II